MLKPPLLQWSCRLFDRPRRTAPTAWTAEAAFQHETDAPTCGPVKPPSPKPNMGQAGQPIEKALFVASLFLVVRTARSPYSSFLLLLLVRHLLLEAMHLFLVASWGCKLFGGSKSSVPCLENRSAQALRSPWLCNIQAIYIYIITHMFSLVYV